MPDLGGVISLETPGVRLPGILRLAHDTAQP